MTYFLLAVIVVLALVIDYYRSRLQLTVRLLQQERDAHAKTLGRLLDPTPFDRLIPFSELLPDAKWTPPDVPVSGAPAQSEPEKAGTL